MFINVYDVVDHKIRVFAHSKIEAEFALQCVGCPGGVVDVGTVLADSMPPVMSADWTGRAFYVYETPTGHAVHECERETTPTPKERPKTKSPYPRHIPQPRTEPELEQATVLDDATRRRRERIDRRDPLPIPATDTPGREAETHLLADEVSRLALATMAWAPWARRNRRRTRRYEGFHRGAA